MKKFVKELATNRFGIVMATLNICYFLSIRLSYNLFTYKYENASLLFEKTTFYRLETYFSKIMLHINSPALLISLFSTFSPVIDSGISRIVEHKLFFVFFLFSIVLQWLFIGWAAKKIAHKISSN